MSEPTPNNEAVVDNEKIANPATLNDLKMVINLFNENNIPYFLIGGYALFVSGYQRATGDIDIVIPMGKENGKKVKDILMALPDKVSKDIDDEWFLEDETIRVIDDFVVDLLF